MATPKRYPLPKRFNAALSDNAYERLRSLNEKYGYGNNYLLTILLENLNDIVDQDALEKAFEEFKAEYGAPATKGMKKNSKNK
ncbi:MAG: hypothetical protein WBM41_20825 [Arenicellales bacterium]